MAWPLSYPGPIPGHSFLFTGSGFEPLVDPPSTRGRTALVACGSNASPERLSHKFAGTGVDPVMAVVRATVANASSVYSHHISRYGAVPATLMRCDGAETTLFVQFVDDEQLALLTASERRSYRLVGLDPSTHPVALESGRPVDDARCFASDHGALGLDGHPVGVAAFASPAVAALTHAHLWAELARRWHRAHPALPTDPATIMAMVANDDDRAATVRDAFDAVTTSCPLGLAIAD